MVLCLHVLSHSQLGMAYRASSKMWAFVRFDAGPPGGSDGCGSVPPIEATQGSRLFAVHASSVQPRSHMCVWVYVQVVALSTGHTDAFQRAGFLHPRTLEMLTVFCSSKHPVYVLVVSTDLLMAWGKELAEVRGHACPGLEQPATAIMLGASLNMLFFLRMGSCLLLPLGFEWLCTDTTRC